MYPEAPMSKPTSSESVRARSLFAGPSLRELFLGGLALAGAACASTPTPPAQDPPTGPVDTGATGVGDAPPLPPGGVAPASTTPELQRYTREFAAAPPYAKAIRGAELLGFIDIDEKTVCTPGPCSKAWKDLVDRPGAHWAIVKRNGALEGITDADFDKAIGPVDSPEKAALRARLEDYRQPATCRRFREAGYECKDGGPDDGVPVRKTSDGFEVAIYGSRNVCSGSQQGTAVVLGILPIARDGKVETWFENDFTKAIDAAALADGHVQCRYPERGRMFEGFVDFAAERNELEYLLRAHRQESAAVIAFERLARELAAHGAPADLVDAARRSADDERRHAEVFRCAAERIFEPLGEALVMPSVDAPADFPVRALRDVLLENLEEGCANETYAAVIATFQAELAPSARLRALFTSIAADEREHAALAHRIHAWGSRVLAADEARDLEERRAAACAALAEHAAMTEVGRTLMGEPSPEVASAAFLHVAGELARAA